MLRGLIPSRWKLGLALALLSATLSGSATRAQQETKLLWSVSLKPQGFHSDTWGGAAFTSVGGVAATSEIVAVLLGNHFRPSTKQAPRKPVEVFLVLYDATSGKFLDKKGPWESGTGFELFANSGGGFVVYLAPFHDQADYVPGKLLLLSPSGDETKRSVLDFGGDPRPGIRLLHSPSLQTILLIAYRPNENRYRVIESETLETKADWVEANSRETSLVIDISDRQFLGMSNSGMFFVREFAMEWKPLPASAPHAPHHPWDEFRSNAPFFLRDSVLVGRAYETKDEFVVPVLEKGGTILSQSSTRRLPHYNLLHPGIASQDGEYFGLLLMHENQLTHWWAATMDMWPAGATYFLYLWKAGSSETPWRIETTEYFTPMCFFPPPARAIALVDGDHLKVFSLTDSQSTPSSSLP